MNLLLVTFADGKAMVGNKLTTTRQFPDKPTHGLSSLGLATPRLINSPKSLI